MGSLNDLKIQINIINKYIEENPNPKEAANIIVINLLKRLDNIMKNDAGIYEEVVSSLTEINFRPKEVAQIIAQYAIETDFINK